MEAGLSEDLGKVQERYRFLAKLGSGGMADVFLGVQLGAEDFRRLIVIKRIHAMWLKKDNALKMFIDEARTVASLNHPHIVKIYDLSRMGKDICIAMEYVDGENLDYIRRFLKKQNKPIPIQIVCKLMVEACEALHYAHSARTTEGKPLNLVHRDIGPHNMMVDSNGYLKVIDFGIAKSTAQTELTSPGMIKGKYSYLAPDLFKYIDIDGRVDLYALGLVLYELLTLRRPFMFKQDVAVAEVLQRITTESLPPVSSLADLPRELDTIVNRAIHKDRDKRYQTGAEFASDLRDFADNFGGVASTTDVERWFTSLFADRIARRREFERRAMAKSSEPQKLDDDEVPVVASQTANISDVVQTQNKQGSGSVQMSSVALAKPRNPYIFLTAAFLLVAGIVVLVYFLFSRGEPEAVLDNLGSQSSLTDNLFIRSAPAGADIYINTLLVGNTGSNGLNLRVEPGKMHQVVLRMPGHEDYNVEVPGETVGQRQIDAKLLALKDAEPPAAKPESEAAKPESEAGREQEETEASLAAKDPRRADKNRLKRSKGSSGRPTQPAIAFASPAPGTEAKKFEPTASESTTAAPVVASKTPLSDKPPAIEPPPTAAPEAAKLPPVEEVAAADDKPTFQSMELLRQRRTAGSEPVFPKVALRAKRTGRLLVKITIDREGNVSSYTFMKDDPFFHDAVIEAITSWRFRPYLINGRPVESYTVYKFEFNLDLRTH